MQEQQLEQTLNYLNQVEFLLRVMQTCATRAASPECAPAERIALQRRVEILRSQIDELAEDYQRFGAV